jgi:UDP:flavonoid glycosyltransferase YjiC (YdhE family)
MRYLFCTPNAVGLLGPSLTIALELRRRGHEVAFATGRSVQPLLEQAGLERIPYGATDSDSFDARNVWKMPEAIRQVRHTEYASQRFAPDVLVGQALTWGTMAYGVHAKLPLAIVGQAGYIWATDPVLPFYQTYAPVFIEHVRERYEGALRMYKTSCQVFNMRCPDVPYSRTPLIGDLYLLQSLPELESYPDLLPPNVTLVGDCTWNPERIDQDLQIWLDETRAANIPLVYLQLGRVLGTTEYVQYLIKTLGRMPVRIVASLGGASKVVTALPENFFVHEQVMQGQVLPYASAVICSGTSTNVLGAVSAGRPLLIITGNIEEPTDLAVRCANAGFGLYLDQHGATQEAVQTSVQALLGEERLKIAARKVQQAFAAVDGPSVAASRLEELGEKRVALASAPRKVLTTR